MSLGKYYESCGTDLIIAEVDDTTHIQRLEILQDWDKVNECCLMLRNVWPPL